MYKIYCDNEVVYDPLSNESTILNGVLKLELNTSGSLKFKIPKDNPIYGRIKLMKSIITLYEDNRLLFRGRAYSPSIDLFCNDEIDCEGELAFLNDSYQMPFNYEVGDVKTLFQKVIEEHNKKMPIEKQFLVGNITVANSTVAGNIYRSSDSYMSTWNLIKDKFLKPLGGYIWIRHEGDKTYIDYLKDLSFIGNQEIKQCINLIDAKKEITSENLATVIVPLGAKVKKVDSDKEEYLTIQSLTGGITIEDKAGIDTYGVITKVTHHDKITTPQNLLEAGKKDLADSLGVTTTISLTAADLSKAGFKVNPFMLGNYVPVSISNLDIEEKMLIRTLTINLLKPESNNLTLGSTKQSFSEQQLKTKESIETVNRNLQDNIKAATVDAVVRAVREANSNINQTANEIRSEVSESYYDKEKANELLESIRTVIKQTAGDIEFDFNKYKEEQVTINGDTSKRFQEINKYIRFVNGDILLGEEGNPITLRIENEKIVFMDSGVDCAYWQNRRFYAVDGEFLNSLKLGKFAFIPRETGNLSFTKVVE